jgi:AraC-like DNA-binding protein
MDHDYPKIYLYRRIVQAKLFIDEHFGEPLDLENISDEAYFSKFHFLRLFRSIYGKTPHQYLTFVRIENAKRMLQVLQTVTDVSLAVGYDSVSSFTGLFKRMVGLTPSAYQQLYREMQQAPLKFVPNCFAETKD